MESDPVVTASSTNSTYSNGFREYYRYHGAKITENNNEYASFTFARSSSYSDFSPYNSNDGKYICLYGGVTKSVGSKTVTTENHYYYIKSGSNYLSYQGSISNQTSTSYASGWRKDGNYLYCTYNSTKYYLNASSDGTLSGSTTASTQWTYSESDANLYTTISGSTYYLKYDSNWKVSNEGYTSTYYLIHSGNNYMTHASSVSSDATVTNTYSTSTPTDTAVRWYYVSGNYFSATESGTMYYLVRSDSNVNYTTSTSSLLSASSEDEDSVTLTYYNGWRTYYAYYSGSAWACSRYTSDTVSINKYSEDVDASKGNNISLTEYSSSSSSSKTSSYDTYPTYFPLTREKDSDGNYTGSGKPDSKNTGYVISGSNLTDSKQGPYGDLRVSKFDIDDISVALCGDSTYSASRLEVVTRVCVPDDEGNYTDKGWTRISDDYNANNNTSRSTIASEFSSKLHYKSDLRLHKYKSSRSQLDGTLTSGEGHIYGMHFMNAAISKSNLITAPNVTVLDGNTFDEEGNAIGSNYTNYQLPQDAIDFNLKEQGFINFFAGSYFTDNNTFFSLHTITRDSSHNITNIQAIKQIYAPASGDPSDDNPYIYSYNGSKPDGAGDLVFDVSWITSPTMVDNAVYYFELPVNKGEYALGSVSGKNGAYLMYLDIGAGMDNYKEVVTTEHIETSTEARSYPKGIDFTAISGGSWTAVTGGDSAAIKVSSTTNADQTLSYSYSSNTLTVSVTGNDPPVSNEYADTDVTVQKTVGETTTALSLTGQNPYTIVRDKTQTESFNNFTSVVTRTVTEIITISGAEKGASIQLPTPVQSSGFTIDSAASYSSTSDSATVNATTGLVSITGTGNVVITMSYSESQSNVETWSTASSSISDDTEGTIFTYHLRDYEDPNMVVQYTYDGAEHIYTLNITATKSTVLYVDALPLDGYTVVIVVNGTETATLTSSSTSITSVDITVAS